MNKKNSSFSSILLSLPSNINVYVDLVLNKTEYINKEISKATNDLSLSNKILEFSKEADIYNQILSFKADSFPISGNQKSDHPLKIFYKEIKKQTEKESKEIINLDNTFLIRHTNPETLESYTKKRLHYLVNEEMFNIEQMSKPEILLVLRYLTVYNNIATQIKTCSNKTIEKTGQIQKQLKHIPFSKNINKNSAKAWVAENVITLLATASLFEEKSPVSLSFYSSLLSNNYKKMLDCFANTNDKTIPLNSLFLLKKVTHTYRKDLNKMEIDSNLNTILEATELSVIMTMEKTSNSAREMQI